MIKANNATAYVFFNLETSKWDFLMVETEINFIVISVC